MGYFYIVPTADENLNKNDDFYIVNCCKNSFIKNEYSIERVRTDWSFLLVKSGIVSIHENKKKIYVSEGECYLFPPKSRQYYSHSNNAFTYWIHLSGKDVDNLIEQFNVPLGKNSLSDSSILFGILENIIKEYMVKNAGYKSMSDILAKLFLCQYSRLIEKEVSHNCKNLLSNVVIAMHDNPHISNEECAKMCYISKENFIKNFKNTYGVTPHKFKQQIIINHAIELITKSNLTISAIAEFLGYENNPLYFNNFFKSATGMYPLKFRKMNANPQQEKLTLNPSAPPTNREV